VTVPHMHDWNEDKQRIAGVNNRRQPTATETPTLASDADEGVTVDASENWLPRANPANLDLLRYMTPVASLRKGHKPARYAHIQNHGAASLSTRCAVQMAVPVALCPAALRLVVQQTHAHSHSHSHSHTHTHTLAHTHTNTRAPVPTHLRVFRCFRPLHVETLTRARVDQHDCGGVQCRVLRT
jgi:hypothetical protein